MTNVKVKISKGFKKELEEKHKAEDKEVREFVDGVRLVSNAVETFDGVYNEIREESEENGELVVEAVNHVEEKTGTDYDDVVEFTSELRNELDVNYPEEEEEVEAVEGDDSKDTE